jgi:hypothetical protein
MPENQNIWILEKCSELLGELRKLEWLMAGCQVGMHESVNPILNYKKTIEKSKCKKRDDAKTLVQLLVKNGVDGRKINEVANFLRDEIFTDFQFMHRIWTVMLWSILENYVGDFLVEWIKRNPEIMKTELFRKLRIRRGEYESLQGDEEYEYIVDRIELQSKRGQGIGRFEGLLEQFGLSGKVDEKLERGILELQQVRHVLVHRNGIVDKRLIEKCPWVASKTGEIIYIDSEKYNMYSDAVANYAIEIGDRALKKQRQNQIQS